MRDTDVLIMGAGCAGTSLAHHLEQHGFQGSITLCDSRSSFSKEQRWCTWGEIPESLSGLVNQSWKKWSVVTESREIIRDGNGRRYSEVYAPDFFKKLHRPWREAASQTRLHLNQEVVDVKPLADGTLVSTKDHQWRAKMVFDARFQGSPRTGQLRNRAGTFLHQTFLGWKVSFPTPVFDPEKVILMDFRVSGSSGLSFMYVLPYSETEALVESTCFDLSPLRWQHHIANLQNYIAEQFGEDYWIVAEESGNLPMSSKDVRTAVSRNHFAIGAAGGAIRPSSGYAFHRIQRTTKEIAKRMIEGRPLSSVRPSSAKYRFLDQVFLKVISANLSEASSYFEALFDRTSPESLARFMVDEGSIMDDLKVVMSLPKGPFLKSLIPALVQAKLPTSIVSGIYEKIDGSLRNPLDGDAIRTSVRELDRRRV